MSNQSDNKNSSYSCLTNLLVIFATVAIIVSFISAVPAFSILARIEHVLAQFYSLTPTPTNTPPTSIVSLGSLNIESEVQPDGTVKNISSLSVNSLGVGDLLLTYPQDMNLNDSGLVRLSITPSKALLSLSTVAVPTQNAALPLPFHYTDRIDIYPVMQAELSGAGFEITSGEQPLKAIVSDRPAEWTWTLKAKQEGSQIFVVRISVPVRVDGMEQNLFTTLKNIPAEVKVSKSLKNQILDSLGVILPVFGVIVAAVIGAYATIQAKEREKRISELENQIAQGATERDKLDKQIAHLKSIRNWQVWRK